MVTDFGNNWWTSIINTIDLNQVNSEMMFSFFEKTIKTLLSTDPKAEEMLLPVVEIWSRNCIKKISEYFSCMASKEKFEELMNSMANDLLERSNAVRVLPRKADFEMPKPPVIPVQEAYNRNDEALGRPVFDIGKIDLAQLDHYQRLELLNSKHHVPDKNFKFPFTIQKNAEQTKRRASHQHLQKFAPWLVYSMSSKGYWCLYCALIFNGHNKDEQKDTNVLTSFVTEAQTDFCDMTGSKGKLNRHQGTDSHKHSTRQWSTLMSGNLETLEGVIERVQEQTKESVNRECLSMIIDLCYSVSRQGIATRGHRDAGKINPNDRSKNEGNWRELVKFACGSNEAFKMFIENANENETYTSHYTYRKIQGIIADLVLKRAISEIRAAPFFSLMFDETSDVTGKSIITIVVRFLKNNSIVERFLGFYSVQQLGEEFFESNERSVTGIVLGKVVLKIAAKLGLDLSKCASVGTDGAAVNVSKEKGAVELIKSHSSSFTTHSYCLSHLLNLCVSSCHTVPIVDFVISLINKTCSFFR